MARKMRGRRREGEGWMAEDTAEAVDNSWVGAQLSIVFTARNEGPPEGKRIISSCIHHTVWADGEPSDTYLLGSASYSYVLKQ